MDQANDSHRQISPESDIERADANVSQQHALDYWNSVSADTDGMLGGFPQVSRIDLQARRIS